MNPNFLHCGFTEYDLAIIVLFYFLKTCSLSYLKYQIRFEGCECHCVFIECNLAIIVLFYFYYRSTRELKDLWSGISNISYLIFKPVNVLVVLLNMVWWSLFSFICCYRSILDGCQCIHLFVIIDQFKIWRRYRCQCLGCNCCHINWSCAMKSLGFLKLNMTVTGSILGSSTLKYFNFV